METKQNEVNPIAIKRTTFRKQQAENYSMCILYHVCPKCGADIRAATPLSTEQDKNPGKQFVK
jgi:hypothetical protein